MSKNSRAMGQLIFVLLGEEKISIKVVIAATERMFQSLPSQPVPGVVLSIAENHTNTCLHSVQGHLESCSQGLCVENRLFEPKTHQPWAPQYAEPETYPATCLPFLLIQIPHSYSSHSPPHSSHPDSSLLSATCVPWLLPTLSVIPEGPKGLLSPSIPDPVICLIIFQRMRKHLLQWPRVKVAGDERGSEHGQNNIIAIKDGVCTLPFENRKCTAQAFISYYLCLPSLVQVCLQHLYSVET